MIRLDGFCFLILTLTMLQLAVANPRWNVIHKLKVAKFVDKIGGDKVFLSVAEAVDGSLASKMSTSDLALASSSN